MVRSKNLSIYSTKSFCKHPEIANRFCRNLPSRSECAIIKPNDTIIAPFIYRDNHDIALNLKLKVTAIQKNGAFIGEILPNQPPMKHLKRIAAGTRIKFTADHVLKIV